MSDAHAATRPAAVRILRWLPLIAGVLGVAWILLGRLRRAELYLFALSVDRGIFPLEPADASATAKNWFLPAIGFLLVTGIAAALTSRNGPIGTARDLAARVRSLVVRHPVVATTFLLACLLDFYTTWAYAQHFTMTDELHAGVKLVAYALGITVGIAVAKAIQAGLVLALAALWPKLARPLILVFAAGYALAAAWNYHWL